MSVLIIRAGILDRLKDLRQIATDEAMARLGQVSLNTYKKYRDAEVSPSPVFIASICTAFDLSIGELVTLAPDYKRESTAA